jgi:hypothetical protein
MMKMMKKRDPRARQIRANCEFAHSENWQTASAMSDSVPVQATGITTGDRGDTPVSGGWM